MAIKIGEKRVIQVRDFRLAEGAWLTSDMVVQKDGTVLVEMWYMDKNNWLAYQDALRILEDITTIPGDVLLKRICFECPEDYYHRRFGCFFISKTEVLNDDSEGAN